MMTSLQFFAGVFETCELRNKDCASLVIPRYLSFDVCLRLSP
jgi:hypothetical protein